MTSLVSVCLKISPMPAWINPSAKPSFVNRPDKERPKQKRSPPTNPPESYAVKRPRIIAAINSSKVPLTGKQIAIAAKCTDKNIAGFLRKLSKEGVIRLMDEMERNAGRKSSLLWWRIE